MEGSKVIQQLLRPTDTCVIMVQGHLLGLTPPSRRLIAIVKHEGTEEHALFLFEVDSHTNPVIVKVEAFYPIKGSFSSEVKETQHTQCQILLNNGMGSSIALQLPYDTHIAVFISQINKALHQYAQSETAYSSSSFSWLLGYENCRTGWDRFSKPQVKPHTPAVEPLINLTSDPKYSKEGFPDTWPWSHIITPNSDGTTEVANCELLELEDFDPLRQKKNIEATPTNTHPLLATNANVIDGGDKFEVSVTNATPQDSPVLHRTSPFHASEDVDPFLSSSALTTSANPVITKAEKGLKHCISDTNLNTLKQEYKPLPPLSHVEPLITRSQEDLTATTGEPSPRHCVASTTKTDHASKSSRTSRKLDDDGPLSRSLFFVPLDESEWVIFDDNGKMNDFPRRQVRSNDTSPTQNRKGKLQGSKHKLEFLNPSGIKAITSSVNMRSPELSGKNNRKGGLSRSRDRSRSAAIFQQLGAKTVPGKRSQWISRYRPGVAVPIQGASARESIMQSELRHREKEFCSSVKVRVYTATWNVNGRVPPFSMDPLLREYQVKGEKNSPIPDIYAIGFQELDLSAQCLLNNESSREDMWVECVERSLRHVGSYTKLCCVRLVGIMLLVYIKDSLCPFVSDIETDVVATGMHGYMGNKGGVGVHFNLYHSSLCFVNSHLSAHMEEVEKRNGEYFNIINKMIFSTSDFPYDIVHHDMIFWIGDLNYRINTNAEMTYEQVKANADAYQFPILFKYDQLLLEMESHNVFTSFTEGIIDFKPTYKYDPNTDNWDSSEKHRAPAWCDRILYRGKGIEQCSYTSHPALNISDHKPVSSIFDTTLQEVDPQKEKSVLEEITWRLDKLENDTLPQVDLNVTEFHFKDVRFKVPQSRRLVVTNTGLRPVHISFILKPDDKSLTKDWLTVKPTSAVIHPMEDAVVEFTVLVDEDSVPSLASSKALLEDILVLHLEKGKDFFITVTGNYLLSCFGSSLETLVNLHTYIREVPVAHLVDLSSSWEECALEPRPKNTQAPPPLDIPKELFAMVDFIERNGINKEGLFSDGGRQTDLMEITNMLDAGGKDLPGSVFSVASVLLTFLAALAEPVVPVSLHPRCMDCCNNVTLCKQILSQMPAVHKKTFKFLIKFMKNLLKHADVSGLDPKVLASIFGEVLLRTPLSERRSKSRRQLNAMNRKKATFLYQFIVNDLS